MKEKMVLLPKKSRFYPSASLREFARRRNAAYPKEFFQTYNEWFYFIHIDPIQRFIHVFGMITGLIFFGLMIINWGLISFIYYILGAFFFYGIGIISHLIYDKGSAKSERKYLLTTFYPVIRINVLTLFGRFDQDLRKFINKYPFVKDAYELEEVPKTKIFSFLITGLK